jgi:hypothetical protein
MRIATVAPVLEALSDSSVHPRIGFPACNPTFLARGALGLDGAALARMGPIAAVRSGPFPRLCSDTSCAHQRGKHRHPHQTRSESPVSRNDPWIGCPRSWAWEGEAQAELMQL